MTSPRPAPRWIPTLPRFRLIDGPSPLQPVSRFTEQLGRLAAANGHRGPRAVLIKREDLLALAFGGNKLRNLEFLIGGALAAGADCVVTSGRRWSNHCRLTAAAAVRARLEAHLILTGPPRKDPGANQLVDELFGAELHFTVRPDRSDRQALVARVATDLRAAGRRPYVIDVGGSGVTGAAGQVLAGLELADQLAASQVDADLVVVSSATGGTQAGLVVGLALAGSKARVRGFAVSASAPEVEASVARIVDELAGMVELSPAHPRYVDVDGSQIGPGYGRRSAAADEAARLLARTEAILVDPIYTGKALAGLVELARTGDLADRSVVFWHAGGTIGLFEPLDGDDGGAMLAAE